MSFRSRLTVFFGLIVVLPMAVVAVLVIRVSGELDEGRAAAMLRQAAVTTTSLYEHEQERALKRIERLAQTQAMRRAWREGSRELKRYLQPAVASGELWSVKARSADGRLLFSLGHGAPFGSVEIRLDRSQRARVESLTVSVASLQGFLDEARALHNRDLIASRHGRIVASTLPINRLPQLKRNDELKLGAIDYWTQSFRLERGANPLQITLLIEKTEASPLESRPLLVAALIGLLAVATVFGFALQRDLHRQLSNMLAGARRIGAGDFATELPVDGNDELAELASEFNAMSAKLKEHVERLESQSAQLQAAIRRAGQAFASGLDRDAILDLALKMAAESTAADYAMIVDGNQRLFGGNPPQPARRALERAVAGEPDPEGSDRYGLAADLGSDGTAARLAVTRRLPFSDTDCQVLSYLAAQVAVSLENVALHNTLAHQAVTDDLTGLANARRFRQLLAKEIERAERFGHKLCLLIADLDHFKQINDTYGHLQGDAVLRRTAKVIADNLREVDEAARYGGEEMVVILPETSLDEGREVAERIRAALEAERFQRLEGDGEIALTVSIGIASYPADATDPVALIAAADRALYAAKSAGRNRVCVAELR